MKKIIEITAGKKQFADLLLIGDEQEEMIAKYLDRGRLFVMTDNENVYAACVVTDEGDATLELKNIAVYPQYQHMGFGKELISFIENKFAAEYRRLIAGTGDSPLTVPFYEKCGFKRSGVIKDFFIDNYDHPIIEAGVRLCDMICFEKELSSDDRTDREGFAEKR